VASTVRGIQRLSWREALTVRGTQQLPWRSLKGSEGSECVVGCVQVQLAARVVDTGRCMETCSEVPGSSKEVQCGGFWMPSKK